MLVAQESSDLFAQLLRFEVQIGFQLIMQLHAGDEGDVCMEGVLEMDELSACSVF